MTHTPSKYQQVIYDWVREGQGHGFVEAVAGSGKTTTLVECAQLIEEGVFCAFNKHIAVELQDRLRQTGMDVATIHSLGFKALRRLPLYQRARVDGSKYGALAKKLVEEGIKKGTMMGTTLTARQRGALQNDYPVADLRELVDLLRLNLLEPAEDDITYLLDHHGLDFDAHLYPLLPKLLRTLLRRGRKYAPQQIDFTDMLYLPLTGGGKFERYPWVFVDEAQDLNRAQLEVVKRSLAEGGRMLAVGDPRQAIYGFAGADSDSVANIIKTMQCTKLPLSICYRCPRKVVALAKQFVPQIEPRPGAPEGEVSECVLDDLIASPHRGDLVLCRTTAPLLAACYRLIKARVSAGVQGRDIGVGLVKVIEAVEKAQPNADAFAEGLRSWGDLMIDKLLRRRGDVESQVQAVQDKVDCLYTLYYSMIAGGEEVTYDVLKKWVENLFSAAHPTVLLSTVHRAKGLERTRVFILRPDLMPHPMAKQAWAQEQERNLMYVAYTRAQEALVFTRKDEESGNGNAEAGESAATTDSR